MADLAERASRSALMADLAAAMDALDKTLPPPDLPPQLHVIVARDGAHSPSVDASIMLPLYFATDAQLLSFENPDLVASPVINRCLPAHHHRFHLKLRLPPSRVLPAHGLLPARCRGGRVG